MTATEIMEMMNKADCKNGVIFENLIRGNLIFRQHNKIMVSISGGSDSDIVLDICEKIKDDKEVEYVWFDTGVEYQATKDHLKYLEERYGIKIKRIKAIKSIPTCVREYGQPFLSKFISETMERLQVHGFDWTDMTYEEMIAKYPDCKSGVMWWCNSYVLQDNYKKSMFNINRIRYLKEFIIENPPQFKISAKCCTYAKKKVSNDYRKKNYFDLSVIGVRKLEGGVRSVAYKSCFVPDNHGIDQYMPVFWYSDQDKRDYEQAFNIRHSDCYLKYGMRRTGCVGCPFSQQLEDDLQNCATYEPKLYKACTTIFKDSYEYTRAFRRFRQKMKDKDQMTIYDLKIE